MKRSILLIGLAALLSSCNGKALEEEENFRLGEEIGLWVKAEHVFTFEQNSCQFSYNPDKLEFRSNDDDMANWMVVTMKSFPAEVGKKLSVDLKWTTASDIKQKKAVEMKLLKSDGDRYWLWSRKNETGAVIAIPTF